MKSDSIVPEIQEVVPLVLKEGSFPEKTVSMQDSHRLEVDKAIRLTINGISVEIANHATQTAIQNTLSALRYLC